MKIITRDVPPRAAWALEQAGLHPLLARLFAARGITAKEQLDDALALLIPPAQMLGAQDAARQLADAMAAGQRVCIVADYDCDGATACAVGVRGLKLLGAPLGWDRVEYLVPDRVSDGYGLTPAIAQRVQWGEARVFYRDRQGLRSSLPARWTSLTPEDPYLAMGAGRSRFRVQDLIDLVALLAGLR